MLKALLVFRLLQGALAFSTFTAQKQATSRGHPQKVIHVPRSFVLSEAISSHVEDLSCSPSSSGSGSGSGSDGETTLEEICNHLKATPANLLHLKSDDGERGVFLRRSIKKNDIILKIPLSSCIRDDKPPIWYDTYKSLHKNVDDDDNFHYNPRKWATRLAASIVDLQIRGDLQNNGDYNVEDDDDDVQVGFQKWLAMMPNQDYLRASLPIHWPEELIPEAKCTALELAIDAAYFARAEASSDLRDATNFESGDEEWGKIDLEDYDIEQMASDAFDIVQTRSCRAERLDGIQLRPSLRILAPIFDFINHGSQRHDGKGSANAAFGLEGDDDATMSLVIRASRSIMSNQEIFIDYGNSARPAWRCLASYGFVPTFRLNSPEDEIEDGEEDESVAEVFMDGSRYEVGSHTIPFDMVEAASISLLEEKHGPQAFANDGFTKEHDSAVLTSEVALRIAKRISDAAFQLLIEDDSENFEDDESMMITKKLSASLRWSQHQVLLNCAVGLRDHAARESEKRIVK
jgi:hypothetical protein